MTFSPIAPAVRAARRLSPSTVRAMNPTPFFIRKTVLCQTVLQDLVAHNGESTGAEPPPAGASVHLYLQNPS